MPKPRLDDDKRRDCRLEFTCTTSENELIREAADHSGLPVAAYIRQHMIRIARKLVKSNAAA